ncbi:serine/threonine-protein kinase RsbW [Pseudorhodobacter antarcticus]|jgi:serine/threonine-protein kinase RsbW|uniref:Serine/threonine-protein kinase RsbW n=1 Tax=Pseudorhodobacter antarcticus TaxID=1077947 RepID=A0A1H8HK28_9RHOB|nr:ATP-binding protein [Pseudorhodobacter antarcticus]SEN56582.1 serine/threonine-protein kinase RsbW [Pseudorhodobacter antarcticus]
MIHNIDSFYRGLMQLVIESDPTAVRSGLAQLLASDMIQTMQDGARGTAEIVLAEVLNNIVEHAYAGDNGAILIGLAHHPDGVHVTVRDQGRPFPREKLPQGHLPEIDQFANLPEGGFGWYLIRTLVRDLTYLRTDGFNHLSFCLPYEDSL